MKWPLWYWTNTSLPCLSENRYSFTYWSKNQHACEHDLAQCEMLSTVWLYFRIVDSCVTTTHSRTFTHPAARGYRSGLISVAVTLIGACVPWLCVSLEYHAEPQSPPSLSFTLPTSPPSPSALSLSLLTTHHPVRLFFSRFNVSFHITTCSGL